MCHSRLTKEYEKCEIIILPKRYNMQHFALGFQKDSPYLGLFNYYLRKMRQEGSLDKNVKGYEAVQQACPDKTGKALGFKNLIFPIFILVLGCLMSFLTLMFEFAYNRVSRHTKEDTNSTENLEDNKERKVDSDSTNNLEDNKKPEVDVEAIEIIDESVIELE